MAEYIKRQTVFDSLPTVTEDKTISLYGAVADFMVLVSAIPAADVVEAKHGRWEEWWPGISLIMTGEEMLYRCTACDAKYADVEGYVFCPNCGARMDGE